MYHYTRDLLHSRYPGIKALDLDLFRQQLEFFNEHFNVVSMEQVLSSVYGADELPQNALLLTFDDGYIDNYTVAFPLLREYGFQGSFFIPGKTFTEHKLLDVNKIHYILASSSSDRICEDLMKYLGHYRGAEYDYPDPADLYSQYAVPSRYDDKNTVFIKQILQTVLPEDLRNIISSRLFADHVGISEEALAYELYMSPEQIGLMKDSGMFIGLHGYDHYWLGDLPEDKMKEDIDRALEAMSPFIDKDSWVMNYPYGSYNEKVISYIVAKGAKLGLTTEVEVSEPTVDNAMILPRLDCNDFPPKSRNYMDH